MRAIALFLVVMLAAATFTGARPPLAAQSQTSSVEELAQKNRGAMGAWAGKATLKTRYAYSGQGMKGEVDSVADLSGGRFVDSISLGLITTVQGFDGASAWAKDRSGAVTIQNGADARQSAVDEGFLAAHGWWRDAGCCSVTMHKENSKSYDVLSVTTESKSLFELWFDAETHLLARSIEYPGGVKTVTAYSDYRPVDGAMIAHRIAITTDDPRQASTMTLIDARFGGSQDASTYAAPKSSITNAAMAGGATETTIPFRLIGNHIFAEVKVDGKGPFQFVVDTGGVNIVTPTLVKQLGLESQGKLIGRGSGKKTVESGVVKVPLLEIGKASIRDDTFYTFALENLTPYGGFAMPGMIGYETFSRFVTRIDYGARTITLIDPAHFDAKDAGVRIPIKFSGNSILVQGSFDGIVGDFQIDSGSGGTLELNAPFSKKNDLLKKYPKNVYVVGGWGVGGPSHEYATRGGRLKIGAVEIDHSVVGFSTDSGGTMADPSMAGNIGNGILKRFIVTFDYEHAAMYLKPVAQSIADLDTFDRSGMWINLDNHGFRIADVVKGDPADNAGLKAGDVIVAVDGKPAKAITLPDLRQRLRDDVPGTSVSFMLANGRTVHVTLRDLI